MPLVDGPTVIPSGGLYDQVIFDWALGDDREFIRTLAQALLPAGSVPVSAYLTIKSNPTDIDVDAIIQLQITTVQTVSGIITPPGTAWILLFHIFSSGYQAFVSAGQVYFYDMRVILSDGSTWTMENGQIVFIQGVTQTDSNAIPPAPPDNGLPNFIGYISGPPTTGGPYNLGDWGRNINPKSGQPSGWTCIASGLGAPKGTMGAAVWRTDGIVGDTDV